MNQPIFASPGDYFDVAAKLYSLILAEIESVQSSDLPAVYPRVVIMYEFFRLIRGEAFVHIRPSVAEKQQQLYAMENEIGNRLAEIRRRLDPEDESVRFHIGETKRFFDINR